MSFKAFTDRGLILEKVDESQVEIIQKLEKLEKRIDKIFDIVENMESMILWVKEQMHT